MVRLSALINDDDDDYDDDIADMTPFVLYYSAYSVSAFSMSSQSQ